MHLLTIVSKDAPLSSLYTPTTLKWDPIMGVWLLEEAYGAFYELSRQMQRDYLAAPSILYGYRSYAYQKKMYLQKQQEIKNKRYANIRGQLDGYTVLPAGCSEHQLGSAIDLGFTSKEEQIKWLDKHSHLFGFVLRYPKEKVWITHVPYSMIHYRYVGINHAKKMFEKKLCLEEYIHLNQDNKLRRNK